MVLSPKPCISKDSRQCDWEPDVYAFVREMWASRYLVTTLKPWTPTDCLVSQGEQWKEPPQELWRKQEHPKSQMWSLRSPTCRQGLGWCPGTYISEGFPPCSSCWTPVFLLEIWNFNTFQRQAAYMMSLLYKPLHWVSNELPWLATLYMLLGKLSVSCVIPMGEDSGSLALPDFASWASFCQLCL